MEFIDVRLIVNRRLALGIEAASFASVVYRASKDIAESPTAIAGTPKNKNNAKMFA